MSCPEHHDRARLLKQGCPISQVSIEAALRLPVPLLRQEITTRLHSIEQIEQLRIALEDILSLLPKVAHTEVWQSLACLSPSTSLRTWLIRLLNKVPRFPIVSPVSDDRDVTLLSSPEAIRNCSARFFNCLKLKVPNVFLGRVIFYEWHSPGAVIELRSLSGGHWSINGIYGMRNQKVDTSTLRAIRAKFEGMGVLVPAQFSELREVNRCADILGIHDRITPDFDDEEFDLTLLEGGG
jgi:hypothetical protein